MIIEPGNSIPIDALAQLPNPNIVQTLTRRAYLGIMAGGALALAGCGTEPEKATVKPASPNTDPSISATSPEVPAASTPTPEVKETLFNDEGLSNTIARKHAESIISTFENSTTVIQYEYAENIRDGRGITAGRSGFTSGTSDLLEVVTIYEQTTRKPHNALKKYVAPLEAIEAERRQSNDGMTDSIKGLKGFEEAWKITSKTDSALNKAQDAVYEELYFNPAMRIAEETGIRSAMGQLIILDTIIQHGEGDAAEELDGLPAILVEVVKKYGTPETAEQEIAWLNKFLAIRQAHLENPRDKDNQPSAAKWRQSVPRVKALQSILDTGNYNLKAPLAWESYGQQAFSLTS